MGKALELDSSIVTHDAPQKASVQMTGRSLRNICVAECRDDKAVLVGLSSGLRCCGLCGQAPADSSKQVTGDEAALACGALGHVAGHGCCAKTCEQSVSQVLGPDMVEAWREWLIGR